MMRKNRQKINFIPIYSPRTSYKIIKATDEKMISDLTLNFDKLTINLLKQEFLKRNNSLDLQQFIVIAMKHLKFWQTNIVNRQIAMVRYLSILFNEIDINGNRDMEWQEFTNFIIEKATVLKNLRSKADQVKQYVKSSVKPKIKIDGIIHKIQYISDMDRIAFCEEGSNKIYFMNAQNGQINLKHLTINPKKLIVNISSVKKEKGGRVMIRKKDLVIPTEIRVLDMTYIPQKKYKILLVSTSDGYVRGWKNGQNGFVIANQPDNEEELFQHFFLQQIYCLAWDHINEVLYCGQKSGAIFIWNLKTDLEKALCDNEVQIQQENGANLLITSMITMPKLQFMASGRMDGKLILWDTINNKKKWVYTQHTRGILTLAFNEYMILLFSAGFDHKICIWNPYISTLIHKIQGHLSPIISLRVIQGTHNLISLDSEGMVKITDTRRFNFIHSFSVEVTEQRQGQGQNQNKISSFSSLIIINKPLKLVFVGKSITIYEYDKNYNPFAADQSTAICCKYVKEKISFFTPMSNKIKVWNALNGDVERIYMEITPYQISTFELDFLKKRMVVGDTKGNITLHNTANGAKIKTLTKHNGQITHLIAIQNDKKDIFISSGLDNEIRICKETQESFEVVRVINFKKDMIITCVVYSESARLIIVGSNVGNLSFFEIQTGKTAGNCYFGSTEQLTSICKVSEGIIIVTTSIGRICLVAIPPLPNRFQKIITFYHRDANKPSLYCGMRFGCYSKMLKNLYVIDDKMYLTCYNLQEVDDAIKILELSKQRIQSERRNNISKAFDTIKITQKWQVKTHPQIVKSLQLIDDEELIVTTSFDKKVKMWSATNGILIDSLQQNYHKTDPTPIAYYDEKSKTLYSRDRKTTLTNFDIETTKILSDPFAIQSIINEHPNFVKSWISNEDWKVNVSFRDIVEREIKAFQELSQKVMLRQRISSSTNTITIEEIKKDLVAKKKKLKQIISEDKQDNKQLDMIENFPSIQSIIKERRLINNGYKTANFHKRSQTHLLLERRESNQLKDSLQKDEKDQFRETNQFPEKEKENFQNTLSRKISTNYFKRSILNCLKRPSKQRPIELTNKSNKMKITNIDYLPIELVLKKRDKNFKQSQTHQQYIEGLYRNQTQSIINGKSAYKIFMTKDEANAASKLCEILMKDDENDKRPRIFHKSIEIFDKRKTTPMII